PTLLPYTTLFRSPDVVGLWRHCIERRGRDPDQQAAAGDLARGGRSEVVRPEVHAVGPAQQRDVDMVIDDEKRVPDHRPELAPQREELSSGERLVPELDDVRAAAEGGRSQLEDARRLGVRRDDVEAGRLEVVASTPARHPSSLSPEGERAPSAHLGTGAA